MPSIERFALLSVSDKTGITQFASLLIDCGFSILSTGGTAKKLREDGIQVLSIEDYTRSPEMMGGRLKTLHPMVFGGLLGRPEDQEIMKEHEMVRIDIVAVNLYPFSETVAKLGCTFEEAIENIDIGGPSMLRAAAKNHARVGVVCDYNDYGEVAAEILKSPNGQISSGTRLHLARKVFAHTAAYDAAITEFFCR